MKIIKKNKLSIIFFLLLIIWITIAAISFYKKYDPKASEKINERCLNDVEFYNDSKPICDDLKQLKDEYGSLSDDTYMTMFTIFRLNNSPMPIIFIMPIFIMFISIWDNQKEINSNHLKNYLTRKSYKQYLKKFFKSAYKVFWILPCYVFYVFLLSYIISGHFNYGLSAGTGLATYGIQYLKLGILFVVLMALNVAIHSLIYANLSMICAKKNKNILLTLLESYILWIVIEIVGEVVNSDLIKFGILDIKYSSIFNIVDLYSYFSRGNIWLTLLISLGYFLISLVIAILVYKNKEKTMVCFEK